MLLIGDILYRGKNDKRIDMKRIQAFEFNELEITPRFIRDAIIEVLGFGLKQGRILDSVGPLFMNFLERANCDHVLDIGSGSGEPASILLNSLIRKGYDPPVITLSDIIPNFTAMERVKARHPDKIRIAEYPVDATNVPESVDCPARVIINVFHHFPTILASRILADSVAKGRAVFIVESFKRKIFHFMPLMASLVPALYLSPFAAKKDKYKKIFFSYFIPLIALCGSWDAAVSFLRTRTREELMDMAGKLSGTYSWEFHEAPYFPKGLNQIIMGFPNQSKTGN